MEQQTNNIDDIQREIDTATKIAKIEVMTEEIYHRLFGNGQPGELDKLKEDVSSLQASRSWIKGVGAALGMLLTGDIGMHIKAFFKN
jgi:hypothetical protein